MKKFLSRFLRTAALAALAVVWCGSASAYLAPDYTDPNATSYVIGPGSPPDYLTTPNWAYTPIIRKFVDTLPGLTPAGVNNLGQYIPLANPDIVTYPGSDYYEIELREYSKKMHSDLPPTRLRGYIQVNAGTDTAGCDDPSLLGAPNPCTAANNTIAPPSGTNDQAMQYLGPLILSKKDRPVRVKFINKLPTGAGGDLFIPVDTTVMGSGEFDIDYDLKTKEPFAPGADHKTGMFTQNRATLHLHGGKSPWISDGTPHQWITPAGEVTDYPTGVSVSNVPDMPDPGPGAQTFFWTNQQSSRMMFYHDHAWGITRLNVYVGEAAGYLIRDPVEEQLIADGIIPAAEIPLVIEDKTFVDETTIMVTDPLWQWGTGPIDPNTGYRAPKTGDLWWPHVYMPAQNPFDITGIAPFGRWAYGPYFYPATNNLYQPVANPYFSELCDPNDPTTPGSFGGYCQPPEVPGTPHPSWGAEAFMDTQTVNGTVYPKVTLEPKPYRLRILNASHDRFVNLMLLKADTTVDPNAVGMLSEAKCAQLGGCATNTEVKMVPAVPILGAPDTWPVDGREGGVPDPTTVGPNWIMIGTEGGFLPKPVVIPPQPVTWNANPSMFNVGNINGGSLILGPAERADVIVDFSGITPGTTLILYNDGAAPWPALNPQYDFYTDNPDGTPSGSAPSTMAGLGPNTRTIMQITIAGTPGTPFDLTALQNAFTHTPTQQSVFERAQEMPIVAQGNMNPNGDPLFYEAFLFSEPFDAYELAYGQTFPKTWPNWGISRINDQYINFKGVDGSTTHQYDSTKPNKGALNMKFKSIHDEMGATFDEYGRMRAALGLEKQGWGLANFNVQTYSDPSTEILEPGQFQVWKISHNGVDTHPIHFHLFDVQVLNRVGWDGFIRLPDPTELGWKDTVRISPLEDTIVALRPLSPTLPFGIPKSYRPMNPARPLGDTMELSPTDPYTGQAWTTPNVNIMRDYNWEYVWHCHILSHEENDMMRPVIFNYGETLPAAPAGLTAEQVSAATVKLDWTDTSTNEIKFNVEIWNTGTNSYQVIGEALANAQTFTAVGVPTGQMVVFRVSAYNAAGTASSNDAAINVATVAPATAVTLVGNPLSPVNVPGSILFTATGTPGGSAPLEYSFWLGGPRTGGVWQEVQPYSASNTWTFNTALGDQGYNYVKVWVRSKWRTSAYDVTASTTYRIALPPATGVTATASPASPFPIGLPTVITAQGSGGVGVYEYRFYLSAPSTGNTWQMVRNYSTTNTWTYTPPVIDKGAVYVLVYVRTAGTTTAVDARYTLGATAYLPTTTGVSLSANPANQTIYGNPVVFTGSGSGGNGQYEYSFQLSSPSTGNVFTTKRNYSTNASWTYTPPVGDVGNVSVRVLARTVGSTSASQATATMTYGVVLPIQSVTLTPSLGTPQTVGQVIDFLAAATGVGGSFKYRFSINGPSTGNAWLIAQDFSPVDTWSWNTSTYAAGVYYITVRATSGTDPTFVVETVSFRINP